MLCAEITPALPWAMLDALYGCMPCRELVLALWIAAAPVVRAFMAGEIRLAAAWVCLPGEAAMCALKGEPLNKLTGMLFLG